MSSEILSYPHRFITRYTNPARTQLGVFKQVYNGTSWSDAQEVANQADVLEAQNNITTLSTPNNALTKAALNATGAAPIYACRAWVNFNGTGTVAIRASGNVSSITDNGTGDYTVNFATAMPDDNYSVANGSGDTLNTVATGSLSPSIILSGSFRGTAVSVQDVVADRNMMMWSFFR